MTQRCYTCHTSAGWDSGRGAGGGYDLPSSPILATSSCNQAVATTTRRDGVTRKPVAKRPAAERGHAEPVPTRSDLDSDSRRFRPQIPARVLRVLRVLPSPHGVQPHVPSAAI